MHSTFAPIRLGLVLIGLTTSVFLVHAFDRDYCEFATNDYSLEWAFEPQSANAVFVLKLNTTRPAFWTGVGFNGSRKSVDFVGVLVRKGQVALADAYINASGVLYTDVIGNVRSIGHEYDGEHLLVKFARPLVSPDIMNDQSLDGCVTFLLPRNPGEVQSHGIEPPLDEFHRFKMCDLVKHCSIDMSEEKLVKKPKEEVKFAKSVDISGSGDPCSFAGENYVANWTYTKPTDSVHFSMRFPVKPGRWWSAVGIGDTMADMDIGVIFVENGKAKKIGDYLSTSYGVPDKDDQEDWKLESSSQKNGEVQVLFSRPVVTEDKEKDRSLDGCVLFQFAANGGRYGDNYAIRKHDDWPDLYKACDLRENCAELSFEKRAKNRKNKPEKKDEEIEPTTLATDENRDESGESTTTAEPKAETPATTQSNEQPPASTTESPTSTESPASTSSTPSNSSTTTTSVKPTVNSHDAPEVATTAEPAEISEEVAGSGEEPSPTTTGTSIESNGSSESNGDIPLDDHSSGQEPTTQESAEDDKSSRPALELTTTPVPLPASTEVTQEVSTTPAESSQLTTAQQSVVETSLAPLPTEKVEIETTTSAQSNESSVQTPAPTATENAPTPSQLNGGEQCDPQKEDLAICQSYMDNYMMQVKEWAARHNEPMDAQFGKACKLLSAVPHVPTLCCHIYSANCRKQMGN